MAKIYDNGVVREMTDAETAALEAAQLEMATSVPTAEERLAALESAMLALIGGGLDV